MVKHSAKQVAPWWKQQIEPTRIIGLDPAQSFGWAWLTPKEGPRISQSGVWKLNVSSKVTTSPGGFKFSQAYKLIQALLSPDGHTVIYYEKAESHRGAYAAHAAGGYYAVIQTVGYDNCVPTHPVPVTALKKFATGSGNADKGAMIEAANRRFDGLSGSDAHTCVGLTEDDRADALWVAAWGLNRENTR